jgi:two-component system, sensor histidine kinase YcbA
LRNEYLLIAVTAAATAVGAEFMIHPFNGDFFRIGLGVSTFLMCLLYWRQMPYVKTGFVTGLLSGILQSSVAAGIYYFVFAFGMSRIQRRLTSFQPLVLGGLVAAIDLLANVTELVTRKALLGSESYHLNEWFFLATIAVVRSYFVIGLFSSISLSQMKIVHREQEKRMEQMLNIGAGLYGEAFYLKKSMETIEQTAATSYDLYRKLKDDGLSAHSGQALVISQQIHEVKKDSQRILAGLLRLYDTDMVTEMDIEEILRFVVEGNREYGIMLKKRIAFEQDVQVKLSTPHYIPLLSVLNNLVANAVEAIERNGTIRLEAFEREHEIWLVVTDNGTGISEQDRSLIFEPGFTTKFNEEGVAATGIGLCHVRDIVHAFGGGIGVEASVKSGGTSMAVRLPIAGLVQGGDPDVALFRHRG